MPFDAFGRQINYLRISLTDQCNLRCVYCMPLHGVRATGAEELLTPEELETVARAAAHLGFNKVRFTGGEPTLRAELPEIVERIARIDGLTDIGMTTNGILMPALAQGLRRAGLQRINIHIDSLSKSRIGDVMRYASLESIWAGIEASEAAGFSPIKLNCVVVKGLNDEEVVPLARLTLGRDWHVRFIELMPFGTGECAQVSRTRLVRSEVSKRLIEEELGPLVTVAATSRSDESRNFRFKDGRGIVGFISPVSEPYCGTCNRMRLTADGKFHLCLLNDDEIDVRSVLRSGAGVERVTEVLLRAVSQKPMGHRLDQERWTEKRVMVQIGG